MRDSVMTREQQYVPQGEALRLGAEAVERELLVTAGRLWVTRSSGAHGDTVGGDCWLDAGERVRLAAGEEAVVEGWPSARYELWRSRRPGAVGRFSAMVGAWLGRTSSRPTPAACGTR